MKWVCINGCVCKEWSSQPPLRRGVNKGDLDLSSAIILSGSNYEKILLMAKFFQLPIMSEATYYRYQRKYILPAIDIYWEKTVKQNLSEALNKDVIFLGDGRMDSPGFCAKFCTYVGIDDFSKNIIALEIIDKRETSLKSTLMEKEGFVRAVGHIEKEGVKIKEVVTDAHSSITKHVREKEPNKLAKSGPTLDGKRK